MNNPEKLSLTAQDDRLCVKGVLDFTAAAGMSRTLHESIAAMPGAFTVDLSGLQHFNSAVLVFMLDCMRMSAAAKKHCQFAGATPALTNMLAMASLRDLLEHRT